MKKLVLALSCAAALLPLQSLGEEVGIVKDPYPLENFNGVLCASAQSAKSAQVWSSIFPHGKVPVAVFMATMHFYPECKLLSNYYAEGESFVRTYVDLGGNRMDVRSVHTPEGLGYYATPTKELHI